MCVAAGAAGNCAATGWQTDQAGEALELGAQPIPDAARTEATQSSLPTGQLFPAIASNDVPTSNDQLLHRLIDNAQQSSQQASAQLPHSSSIDDSTAVEGMCAGVSAAPAADAATPSAAAAEGAPPFLSDPDNPTQNVLGHLAAAGFTLLYEVLMQMQRSQPSHSTQGEQGPDTQLVQDLLSCVLQLTDMLIGNLKAASEAVAWQQGASGTADGAGGAQGTPGCAGAEQGATGVDSEAPGSSSQVGVAQDPSVTLPAAGAVAQQGQQAPHDDENQQAGGGASSGTASPGQLGQAEAAEWLEWSRYDPMKLGVCGRVAQVIWRLPHVMFAGLWTTVACW